jgi:hypothetical protein
MMKREGSESGSTPKWHGSATLPGTFKSIKNIEQIPYGNKTIIAFVSELLQISGTISRFYPVLRIPIRGPGHSAFWTQVSGIWDG